MTDHWQLDFHALRAVGVNCASITARNCSFPERRSGRMLKSGYGAKGHAAYSAGHIGHRRRSRPRTAARVPAGLGVDLCFQNFRAEELPGYLVHIRHPTDACCSPDDVQTAVGCVALQGIDLSRCEMKRLYVRSTARGLGLGRTLVTMILDAAREIGYREIMLDTLPTMTGAQRLYAQFGFHPIAPYRPNPVSGTQYLALSLTSSPSL